MGPSEAARRLFEGLGPDLHHLPPALVYLAGFGFHAAAATSTWAFLFCGEAGTLSYSGRRSIDWRMAAWLGAGVVPTFNGGDGNDFVIDNYGTFVQ